MSYRNDYFRLILGLAGAALLIYFQEDLEDFLVKNGNALNTIMIGKKMPCRFLKDESQTEDNKMKDKVFAFGTVTPTKLNLSTYNNTLSEICVVHPLGLGDSGNVCLGISKSGGSCCAVKFYHNIERRDELAEEELKEDSKQEGLDTK